MMEYSRLLLALTLTWLPGLVWLLRLVPRDMPGRSSLVAGYGLFLGLVVIPVIMRVLSATGIPFSFTSIGLSASLLILAGLLLPAKYTVEGKSRVTPALPPRPNSRWELLFICICLGLIILRLGTLGLEVGLRPIFAWDGKQHWAKQAKVFYEYGSIVQYVSFQDWLELGGKNIFTTVHPDYPVTVPLLQAWVSVAVGRWHESLINLPWLLCYIALGLIFYGQGRAAGARTVVAVAGTYMVLSLPYLNIQVALAGYADLFLTTCYLAAAAAFLNWANSRDRGQAIIAAIFALSCLLIKNEGFFWLLSFVPALVLAFCRIKRGTFFIACLCLTTLILIWLLPDNATIAGQTLEGLDLYYRPESWHSIYEALLVQDNWHLLGYISIALVMLVLTAARSSLPPLAPLAGVVFSAFCMFLVLYLFTRHSHGALHFTSINRVALQLIPTIAFFTMLLYLRLYKEDAV